MSFVWGMINSFQMLSHLMLFKISLPAEASIIFNLVLSFSSINLEFINVIILDLF